MLILPFQTESDLEWKFSQPNWKMLRKIQVTKLQASESNICPLELREVKGIYLINVKKMTVQLRPLEAKEYHTLIKFAPAIFSDLRNTHPEIFMLFCAAACLQRSFYLNSLTMKQRMVLQNEVHSFKTQMKKAFPDRATFSLERANIDARTFLHFWIPS